MSISRPHKRLDVWPAALDLVEAVYTLVKTLPAIEDFGLKSQMRRAVISVLSNLAEGLSRPGPKDRIRFLSIARSSLVELDAQLEACVRLKYVSSDSAENILLLIERVEQMIVGLMRSLKR